MAVSAILFLIKINEMAEKARELDLHSKTFKNLFYMPKGIYLCGNSLGLQPRATEILLRQELEIWQEKGVKGHFDHDKGRPWVSVDDYVRSQMASIVGALEKEVVVMNSLTVNLHLLLVSFYKPTKTRFKIIMESKAFPSDYFCIESQVKLHGHDPHNAIIQVEPLPGNYTLTTDQILNVISQHGDETALVMFSGIQYYTGQLFDIKQISNAAIEKVYFVSTHLGTITISPQV
jgi:kynureninase